MSTSNAAVILDFGSHTVKGGVSSADQPCLKEPAIIGRNRRVSSTTGDDVDFFTGSTARRNSCLAANSTLIDRGCITDFEKFGIYVRNFAKSLDAKFDTEIIEESPMVVTGPIWTSVDSVHRLGQLLFEELQIPRLQVESSGKLSLFAMESTNAIIVDVGHGLTRIGKMNQNREYREVTVKLAGQDIDSYLQYLIAHRASSIRDLTSRVITQFKEEKGFVLQDPTTIPKDPQRFRNDGGSFIEYTYEHCWCPEVLFYPSHNGKDDAESIIHQTALFISDCEKQGDIASHIILCGGSAQLSGLKTRFEREVNSRLEGIRRYDCEVSSTCAYTAWVGGAVAWRQSLPFSTASIYMEEYQEQGQDVMNRLLTSVQ